METAGWQAAERLMERFGGERIYIPKLASAVIARRDAAILKDHDAGMTYAEIAERYGITPDHARMIVHRRNSFA